MWFVPIMTPPQWGKGKKGGAEFILLHLKGLKDDCLSHSHSAHLSGRKGKEEGKEAGSSTLSSESGKKKKSAFFQPLPDNCL